MPIKDISYSQIQAGKLTLAENDAALKYSDNPETLKTLMAEVAVSIEPIGLDYHFDGDKEKRLVLRVYIARGKKEISFRFGMSINDTIYLTINRNSTKKELFEYLKIRFPLKKHFVLFDAEFNMAQERFLANKRKEINADLLYFLLTCCRSEFSCPDTFEEFCSEFGYDTDSRKAEKTFYALREQSNKLHTIFTNEEIDCLPS